MDKNKPSNSPSLKKGKDPRNGVSTNDVLMKMKQITTISTVLLIEDLMECVIGLKMQKVKKGFNEFLIKTDERNESRRIRVKPLVGRFTNPI